MFYHQGILQKRGGKFGIIWLAATKIDRLKRRELSSVKIQKTCEDVIDYILVRGKGRTRFSLYLSSQLMYGIVRVFSRHNNFLLEDLTSFFSKLRLAAAMTVGAEIDLKAIYRPDFVTNPDVDAIAFPSCPGYNPTFGDIRPEEQEVIKLADMEMLRVNSSMDQFREKVVSPDLQMPSVVKSPSFTEGSFKVQPVIGSPHTVSSIEEITMKEVEARIPDIEVPGERELPGFDGKELDVIMEEQAAFEQPDWMRILSPVRSLRPEEPFDTEQLVQQTDILSPKEKTPRTRPGDEIPVLREITLSPGVTPISEYIHQRSRHTQQPSLTLHLSPLPPSPAGRKRKRQLFIDRDTQLSKTQLKKNMATSQDTCQSFVLPDLQDATVNKLFKRPGSRGLKNEQVLRLWQRNTIFGLLETEQDKALPVWTVPEIREDEEVEHIPKRRKRHQPRSSHDLSTELLRGAEVQPGELEMPSIEVARDASVSIDTSRHRDEDSVSIHRSVLSDGDRSSRNLSAGEESLTKRRTRRSTRSRGGVSSEEELDLPPAQESVVAGGDLYQIQEEKEIPLSPIIQVQAQPSDIEVSSTHDDLIRDLNALTSREKWTSFQDVCPVDSTSRKKAARMFSALLDLCATKKVRAEQEVAYGILYICRGSNHW